MRIDVHCHLFQNVNSIEALNSQFKEFRGYGFFERILRYMEDTKSIKTDNIMEKTIFHIKRAKIDKVVLLPLSIKENEKVKEWTNYAPEVFIPFFNPPEKPIGTISIGESIENAVIKDNFRGLKVMLPFRKKNLNDKILYPALEVAQNHKIVVLMHSGYPPPGTKRNVLTYSNPVNIDELISSFPKLCFILAHMGFP